MFTNREIWTELRRELKQYEASIDDLTQDERNMLHKWVADGKSVYDNAYWLAGEDGNPLCYIEAERLIIDYVELSGNL